METENNQGAMYKAVLFLKNNRRWPYWIGLSMLAVILAALVMLLLKPPRVTATMVVNFPFLQAGTGKYPNGADFALTDVVSAPVLSKVWQKHQLGKRGISLDAFFSSVGIAPYTPAEPFIRARYQAMLGRKGMAAAEISAIEKEYRTELEAEARRSARISLSLPLFSGMASSEVASVMNAILQEWSSEAINKLGVLSVPLYEKQAIGDDVVKKGSPFQIVDYFYSSTARLRAAALQLKKYPGAESARDAQTGWGMGDILRQLDELERFWLIDFDTAIQQSGDISNADVQVARYRLSELKEMKQQRLDAAASLKAALMDYDVSERQAFAGRNTGNPQSPELNLEGDVLFRIIELAGKAKEKQIDFRQELTLKRIVAEQEARSLDIEIERLERRVAGASKTGEPGRAGRRQAIMEEIVKRLTAVSAVLARIEQQQAERILGSGGQLFSAGSVSNGVTGAVVSAGKPFVIAIFAVFLVGLIFLILARIPLRFFEENKGPDTNA